MTDCYCDYDLEPAELYIKKKTKARKEHKCLECGHPIKIGEIYERVTGKWDGIFDSFKTCPDCVEIRDALLEMDCFCWYHESLHDDIQMQFEEAEFCPGLRFAYLRILINHRAVKNRNRYLNQNQFITPGTKP